MNKLTGKPSFLVKDVFNACVSSFQKDSIKIHYNSIRSNVILESQRLEMLFASKNPHVIISNLTLGTIPVTKDDMIALYDEKLVKSVKGRPYYDKIMVLASNGKCPYCGVRNVKTLDHFMAKSIYPIFSVTPINLLPCCSDCNKEKKSIKYTSYIDTPINPYFDDYNNDEWLFADFTISNNRPIFNYFTNRPLTWSIADFQKINNHCNVLGLYNLYQIEANSEFVGILHKLKKYKHNGDPIKLKSYFEDMHLSYKDVDKNSYQTAMYRCLMTNYTKIYDIL